MHAIVSTARFSGPQDNRGVLLRLNAPDFWQHPSLQETDMRKSGFSEEQIIKVLKEHAAGLSAEELRRKCGVTVPHGQNCAGRSTLADMLGAGRRFRILTLVDGFTREWPASIRQ